LGQTQETQTILGTRHTKQKHTKLKKWATQTSQKNNRSEFRCYISLVSQVAPALTNKYLIYNCHSNADISKYAGPSDLTGKNQAGPTMFSAYRSKSPVKICYLLRSGNNFLFVGPSNSVFKSWSFFLQYHVYFFK
jgi:hypothetical protein